MTVIKFLSDVRTTVERHKAKPQPTICQHCGTRAAEIVCHICKKPKLGEQHPENRVAVTDRNQHRYGEAS